MGKRYMKFSVLQDLDDFLHISEWIVILKL